LQHIKPSEGISIGTFINKKAGENSADIISTNENQLRPTFAQQKELSENSGQQMRSFKDRLGWPHPNSHMI
jgi:hypothetical protein